MEASAAMYDLLIDDFRDHRNLTGAGLGVAAAGGTCVAVGAVLLIRGAGLRRASREAPQLGLLITPSGGWLSVGGRW